jgi:hypothetical protein
MCRAGRSEAIDEQGWCPDHRPWTLSSMTAMATAWANSTTRGRGELQRAFRWRSQGAERVTAGGCIRRTLPSSDFRPAPHPLCPLPAGEELHRTLERRRRACSHTKRESITTSTVGHVPHALECCCRRARAPLAGAPPHRSSAGGERDEEDLYGEDKSLRVFLQIFMTTEGVWTQVAQYNKFGVLYFNFTSLWT